MILILRQLLRVTTLAAILGACTQITLVKPERQDIGGVYTVEPGGTWNRINDQNFEIWTVDGYGLQDVRFFKGVEDKKTLFPGDDAEKMPVFSAGMTPNDVLELVIDTLSAAGASQVKGSALRPADFGSAAGFRFEFSFLDADGLEFDGMAGGAIIDGRLHMIYYTGTRSHYFPKYRDQVDKLIRSVVTT